MQSLKIEGAVPGSFIEIVPTRAGDWYLKVCEGVDLDSMKNGVVASVKLYGVGKTSNNSELGTDLMRVIADFYNSRKSS